MRTPLALLVDDPTPLVHLYRHHVYDLEPGQAGTPTGDGRPLAETIPNEFLTKFCDLVAARGIRGKFSIVPAPAMRGDIVRGIAGYPPELTRAWLEEVRRLAPAMDFGPEMINHSYALDLATGAQLGETEHTWSQRQSRATLTPYLARALAYFREAGLEASGVTSPWMFGEAVEGEYVAAIAAAQREVFGRSLSWYCLRWGEDRPNGRPWVALRQDGNVVVSTPFTVADRLWDTIWKHGRLDRGGMAALADVYVTSDGRGGIIPACLAAGGWPGIAVHWQCLWSNGHETGLAVLDEVAVRINTILGDRVEWVSCLDLARRTAAGPGG